MHSHLVCGIARLGSDLHDTDWIASYPDLLTPVFVTCNTNVGGCLLKFVMCSAKPGRWVPECWVSVEEWHIPDEPSRKRAH